MQRQKQDSASNLSQDLDLKQSKVDLAQTIGRTIEHRKSGGLDIVPVLAELIPEVSPDNLELDVILERFVQKLLLNQFAGSGVAQEIPRLAVEIASYICADPRLCQSFEEAIRRIVGDNELA